MSSIKETDFALVGAWFTDLRKAALFAGAAMALAAAAMALAGARSGWAAIPAFGITFPAGWNSVPLILSLLIPTLFFWTVYRSHAIPPIPRSLRRLALLAAVVLGIYETPEILTWVRTLSKVWSQVELHVGGTTEAENIWNTLNEPVAMTMSLGLYALWELLPGCAYIVFLVTMSQQSHAQELPEATHSDAMETDPDQPSHAPSHPGRSENDAQETGIGSSSFLRGVSIVMLAATYLGLVLTLGLEINRLVGWAQHQNAMQAFYAATGRRPPRLGTEIWLFVLGLLGQICFLVAPYTILKSLRPRGEGKGSRSKLLAYGFGGLAAVLAAVWFFIGHNNVQKPAPKVEPQTTQQPAPATSAPASREPALETSVTKAAPAPVPEKSPEKPSPLRARDTRINAKDGLTYVRIPPGSFTMGCSPGDTECDSDEKPPHAEQIANGFWLGQTEVTQAAWKRVMNNNSFKSDQLPVESVDWKQAGDYCKAIGGRLPTEKEWEYAARAGTTGVRYGSLDAIAWHSGNSGLTTHPVGLKEPNAFGLYDMLGNVWEWTADDWAAYPGGSVDDCAGCKDLRGGSWNNNTRDVRASSRGRWVSALRNDVIGFRCVGEFR